MFDEQNGQNAENYDDAASWWSLVVRLSSMTLAHEYSLNNSATKRLSQSTIRPAK